MTLENPLILLVAMLCLVVGPTFIVHLLYRRAEKRRRKGEEDCLSKQRRKRGRMSDTD